MRWPLTLVLIFGFALVGGFIFAKGYPYRLYSHWMKGEGWNKYYSLEHYKSAYLRPIAIDEVPPYNEDYSQLWRDFPIGNTKIPMPVRHPLFQTVPLIESFGKKNPPQVGMIIYSPNDREISRVYALPTSLIKDYTQGQELFKLPYVRNRLLKIDQTKLWQDVFSYSIEVKSKSLDDMIYDLYVLYLRSKMLPNDMRKYGLLKDTQALVELDSNDKDYIIELVMNYDSGRVDSYILKTEKNNEESRKLRAKFLDNISFVPADKAMGKILYTEFKQLNFARQVDQEGMLYLFSAWTQETESVELLKEMIFYLERGRNRGLQLRPLYTFAMKHYGKTFTTRNIFNEHDDPNLVLQRKIEIENIERTQEALRTKEKAPLEAELTPDEKMNLYLKKAKEEGPLEAKDMTIH